MPGGSCPPGPVGMLTVRLVRVQGLRSEDVIGQSDPYVVVQVNLYLMLYLYTFSSSWDDEVGWCASRGCARRTSSARTTHTWWCRWAGCT